MKDHYSLYEAKTQLSAILRRVREGRSIIVTLYGEPVAEIRPIPAAPNGIAARLKQLTERGVVTAPPARHRKLKAGPRRPGALARFLDDRDA